MESLDQLDTLRVTELRDFIRRHGYMPSNVPRLDGTPGHPLKTDLLRAARQIWHDLNSKSPARQPPSVDSTNPFQQLSTPRSPSQQDLNRRLSVAVTPPPPPPVTLTSAASLTVPDPVPEFAATKADMTTPPQPPKPSAPRPTQKERPKPRDRRRSHVAINPSFSHLFAPKGSKPALSTPRTSLPTRDRAVAQAHMRRADVAHPLPALPPMNTTPPPEQPEEELREPPSPPTPVVTRAQSASQSAVVEDPEADDVDDNDDDDDLGYDAGGEQVDLSDHLQDDEPTPRDDVEMEEVVWQSSPEQPTELVETEASGDETASDFASDFDSSVLGDSDGGSIVDTDDEVQEDVFVDWSVRQVQAWLSQNGVKFQNADDLSQLLPLARGHKMYLDTNMDDGAIIVPPNVTEVINVDTGNVEDEILPRVDRRRISAPDANENTDEIQHVAATRASQARRRVTKRKTQMVQMTQHMRRVPLKKRVHATFLAIIAGIMLSSVVTSLLFVYRKANMPYCDSLPFLGDEDAWNLDAHLSENPSADGVAFDAMPTACRTCPLYGICINGLLECKTGFVHVDGRCAEDEEVSLYAVTLANEAYDVLCNVAGEAECRRRDSGYMRWDDITSMVRENEERIAEQSVGFLARLPFWRRRRMGSYDRRKFDVAMVTARSKMAGDASFDISMSDVGEFICNDSKLTFRCTMEQFAWAHLRWIILTFVSCFLIGYLSMKRYFKALYLERVNDYYQQALNVLRVHKEDYDNQLEDHAFVKDVILRADVLGRITSRNVQLWKVVEKRLEEDARVLRYSRTVSGVPSYTFEWAGRRRSSSVGDGLSRRGSFGSRASLDSLELPESADFASHNNNDRRSSSTYGRLLSGQFWSDRED